jgi:hypothetical protein
MVILVQNLNPNYHNLFTLNKNPSYANTCIGPSTFLNRFLKRITNKINAKFGLRNPNLISRWDIYNVDILKATSVNQHLHFIAINLIFSN